MHNVTMIVAFEKTRSSKRKLSTLISASTVILEVVYISRSDAKLLYVKCGGD